MSITAVCHQCGSFATAPDSAAGSQCQCPNCGAKVQIPGGVAKLCCVCKADVAHAPRSKDAAGNYYCAACGAKASAAEQAAALAAAGLLAPCVLCQAPAAKSTLLNFDGQWVCQRCAGAEGLGTLSYRLRKARLGALRVVYHCPRCRGELESALAEAGKPDACPQCGCDFEVPGRYEAFKAEQAKAVALTTPPIPATAQSPTAAETFSGGPPPPAVPPATPPRRWLWPVVFGVAAALLVLLTFLAVFFVKEIRSTRRGTRQQHHLRAGHTPAPPPIASGPPARPAVSKSPTGQQKAPKKNNPAPRPEKKPTPIKPGLTAAEIAAQKAKARAVSLAAAAKAKELAAELAAESQMGQEPIAILNKPIFGIPGAGGLRLGTSPKEADKIATVQKVKAFMVVFPPKIAGGTLSLVAADKKTKWNANRWYSAKDANLAITWRPSSSADLGSPPAVSIAHIKITAFGMLAVSPEGGYSSTSGAGRRAVDGMVVDVLRRGNKIERIQVLTGQPEQGVVALANNTPRSLGVKASAGWQKTAVVEVESFDSSTATLNFGVGPPGGNSRRSMVVKLPIIAWAKPKSDWARVAKDLTTALPDAPRLQKPPPPVRSLPPLGFWLVKAGMRNNYAGLLKKLDALAAPSEPWLSQI